MNIQLDLIDLITELETQFNRKLHSLAVMTYLNWSDLLDGVLNDYKFDLLTRLVSRVNRRFEKLGLATPD